MTRTKTAKLALTEGDLLLAPEAIIAHGCNLRGAMGAGVALAVKNRWPEVNKAYEYAVASGALSLGAVIWAQLRDERWIANVITQSTYGRDGARYVSYDALDKGLRAVSDRANELNTDTVAIPPIGLGLGGGRWPVVRAILDEVITDKSVNFNMYVKDHGEYLEYVELFDL